MVLVTVIPSSTVMHAPPPPHSSTRTLEVYVPPDCEMRHLRELEDTIKAAVAENETYSKVQSTMITKEGTEVVYKKFSVNIKADCNTKDLVAKLRGNDQVEQVAIVQDEDDGGEGTDAPALACIIL